MFRNRVIKLLAVLRCDMKGAQSMDYDDLRAAEKFKGNDRST